MNRLRRLVAAALLLACGFALCVPARAAGIPSDAEIFSGHAYKAYGDSMTWTAAKSACEARGGHLATVSGAAENAFLKALVSGGRQISWWIGLYQDSDGSPWKWVTGEPVTYANWAKGYPSYDRIGGANYADLLGEATPWSAEREGEWTNQANDGYPSQASFHYLPYVGYICEWDHAETDVAASAVALGQTDFVYDGTAKKPAVTVVLDGTELTAGKDYKVTYSNNKNAGTATVAVRGKGRYKGTKKVTFSIQPAPIQAAAVTLNKSTWTCTGKAIRPSVKVKAGGRTLKKNRDFRIVLSGNVGPGTGRAVIAGTGNYTGEASASFEIVPGKPSLKLKSKAHGEIDASCKAVKGADGYEFVFEAVSGKAPGSEEPVTVSACTLKSPTGAVTASALIPGAVYRVRARAYAVSGGETVYGPYCREKKIRVKRAKLG